MINAYESNHTGVQHDTYVTKSQLVDLIYPIGSIYVSTNSVSPATLFGGTWEQIKDKFLLCAGDTYAAGNTGGSSTKTIDATNLPSHAHTVGAHAHGLNGHTHGLSWHTHGTGNATYTHFLMNNGTNVGVNGTARAWPSGSGSVHYIYSTGTFTMAQRNSIGGPSTNTSEGPSTANTANSAAFSSGATGSGAAFDIMPPYLTVYVFKRTA